MRRLSTLRGVLLTTALLGLVLASCSSGISDDAAGPDGSARPGTTQAVSSPLERYAGYQSVNYDDPAHWLCLPGADDVCSSNLDATAIEADGSTTVQPFAANPDAPIDCFYVYPTISKDSTTFSDWVPAVDQEGYAAANQVARLGSQCRVYAPVYRQLTLAGLAATMGQGSSTEAGAAADPFGDVLDAFRTYMAEYNDGRGVVLVGHSQGSTMLRRLVMEEIDPNPDVRAQLVSAYLAGWPVGVPPGSDVGGDFKNVPVCREADQTGCFLAWSSFRSTSPPPPDAVFGRVRDPATLEAACASPATVVGEGDRLEPYFPASASASMLESLGTSTTATSWLDPSAGTIATPYVTLPGLVTGECVSNDGFNYLSVTVHPDPTGPRADEIVGDLTPQWGLHLIDVSLEMGNMVDLVTQQSAAYTASHPD